MCNRGWVGGRQFRKVLVIFFACHGIDALVGVDALVTAMVLMVLMLSNPKPYFSLFDSTSLSAHVFAGFAAPFTQVDLTLILQISNLDTRINNVDQLLTQDVDKFATR